MALYMVSRKEVEKKAKAMKALRRALVQAELPAIRAPTFAGNLFCFQPKPSMYCCDVLLLLFSLRNKKSKTKKVTHIKYW